ncbi:MAG TPA: sulfotransferase [Ardenticatenaceae bacterium]|nr:sulfotransferase [Ardenticatenaceae bacterium]
MLPNLIIIGGMKCGTTSLHYYLGLHPQISMSKLKELDFFIEERNWRRGVEWYRSNFQGAASIYGESSTGYSAYPHYDGVPARMHSVVPDARLIYILRDPIERIVSQYVHNCSDRRDSGTIADVLNGPRKQYYIDRSKYYMQLEQYLRYFPLERILVITSEELYRHRLGTLRNIFRFLGVDDSFVSERFSEVLHASAGMKRKNLARLLVTRIPGMDLLRRLPPDLRWRVDQAAYLPFTQKIERPEIDAALRQQLIDVLQDDVERLRDFTGRAFHEWSL